MILGGIKILCNLKLFNERCRHISSYLDRNGQKSDIFYYSMQFVPLFTIVSFVQIPEIGLGKN